MATTTAEQLERATGLGRCELIRGELRMMIPAGGEHGRIAGRLTCLLGNHVMSNELGSFYAAETGFLLARDPDTVRAPDFAFARAEPAPTGRGFVPGAPDLAVEVLSPDDRPGYVREKVAEWLESGATEVWVVSPRDRTVTVHGREPDAIVYGEADEIPGGDLLPDLRLAVKKLFV
ncbi:MAG: Uma2 family endonuclease [Planctomycetota bacterium]|jgi:Uma2 family endonuclease